MINLKTLYNQLEVAQTTSERFDIWKQIKQLEKEIENAIDHDTPAF
ncbi:hypothetical protein [Sporosarcina globispora]|nr:hypothetical protein [Sporosarcina globispora]